MVAVVQFLSSFGIRWGLRVLNPLQRVAPAVHEAPFLCMTRQRQTHQPDRRVLVLRMIDASQRRADVSLHNSGLARESHQNR